MSRARARRFDSLQVAVFGTDELAKTLDTVAKEQPKILRSALSQEIANVKRSISATVRNNAIRHVEFDPNGRRGKGSWKSRPLAPRHEVTVLIHGKKGGGLLGHDRLVNVCPIGRGMVNIGYKGNAAEYIKRWQTGVPQEDSGSENAKKWLLYTIMGKQGRISRIGPPGFFVDRAERDLFFSEFKHNPPELHTSPPRPFMDELARIAQRDFATGLLSLIQKKIDGVIETREKRLGRKFESWRFRQ